MMELRNSPRNTHTHTYNIMQLSNRKEQLREKSYIHLIPEKRENEKNNRDSIF